MSTLTMQDVAELASVSRQAVSMWRKRPSVRGVSIPFTAPRGKVNGIERFDRDEIVSWLAQTGRGNASAADAGLDAPAFAAPDDLTLEDAVTLLTWHVLTSQFLAGTTAIEREALARESDPDDQCLLREILAIRPTPAALRYIDDVVAVSFGPPDALRRLESGRLSRALGSRDLTIDALSIIATAVDSAVTFLGSDSVVVHGRGDCSLALRAADTVGRLMVTGDSAATRAVRRRARIGGIDVLSTADAAGTQHPVVIVASVVAAEPGAALDLIDDITVSLPGGAVAIILGSATLLVDRMTDAGLRNKRSTSLRVGNAVAALRLPRGLWREAHRQNLGLWICWGGVDREYIALGDVAKIDAHQLGDLGADIAGALAGTGRRSYRFLRPVLATQARGDGAVVPAGIKPVRLPSPAGEEHIDRILRATEATGRPLDGFDALVTKSVDRLAVPYLSLGELVDRKRFQVKRRSRISPDDATSDGTIRVLPDDVFRLDPIEAERRYPSATRTVPGDVIFVEQPVPRAWVDDTGNALVAHPAYILRGATSQASAEVGDDRPWTPYLVAAAINRVGSDSREWRRWSIPVPHRVAAEQLEATLVRLARYERELDLRRKAAHDLAHALIDGVVDGAISLNPEEEP